MAMATNRLGDLLIRNKLLTAEQVDKAIAEQKLHKERFVATLVRLKYISEEEIGRAHV